MLVHCSTQHPSEMQHLVAHAPRPAVAPRAGRVPAHGRRLRRQGVAVGAVRLRRGGRRAQAEAAGQAAPRPRRRLPDHRPAPLLPLRLRGRLRRRRPRPRRRADDGLARRLLGRPVRPGDDARALPLRQRLLAARRRDARLLRQDQHAEQHRLPRLRRAAGRDRDREHRRLRSRARSARTRSTCGASTSTASGQRAGERNVTPYGQTIDDNIIDALVAELEATQRLPRPARRDRRVQRDQPGAQARPGADAGQVRHLVQRRPPQPGRRAGARLHRRLGAASTTAAPRWARASTPRSRRSWRTSSASLRPRARHRDRHAARSPTPRPPRRRPAAT